MDFQTLKAHMNWRRAMVAPTWLQCKAPTSCLDSTVDCGTTYQHVKSRTKIPRLSHTLSLISGSQNKKVSALINISLIYSATMGYPLNILGVSWEMPEHNRNPNYQFASGAHKCWLIVQKLTKVAIKTGFIKSTEISIMPIKKEPDTVVSLFLPQFSFTRSTFCWLVILYVTRLARISRAAMKVRSSQWH